MDDKLIVVALRVEDCDFTPSPRSTTGHYCVTCESEVWLSPLGVERLEAGGELWCSRCVAAAGVADSDSILPPTDEQMEIISERMRHLGLPIPLSKEEVLAIARRHLTATRRLN